MLTAHRLRRAGRPDLIPVLTPDYSPGCKRIAKSSDYLDALAKPNVTVVPRAVKETFGNTVVDTDGNKQQVDILVLATGFDIEGFLGNLLSKSNIFFILIVGKKGILTFIKSSRKKWIVLKRQMAE